MASRAQDWCVAVLGVGCFWRPNRLARRVWGVGMALALTSPSFGGLPYQNSAHVACEGVGSSPRRKGGARLVVKNAQS